MKPEARLWQATKDKMVMPGDRVDRIENSVGSGAPDTNGCLSGEDFWMELKAPVEPKRPTTPLMTSNGNHPLLPSQIGWFARQRYAGGIAYILVRTDKRLMLLDGTKHADAFNKMTVQEMINASLHTAKVPTPVEEWRYIRNLIFTASRHRRLAGHASAQQLLAELERKGETMVGDRDARRCAPVGKGANPAPGPTPGNRGSRRADR